MSEQEEYLFIWDIDIDEWGTQITTVGFAAEGHVQPDLFLATVKRELLTWRAPENRPKYIGEIRHEWWHQRKNMVRELPAKGPGRGAYPLTVVRFPGRISDPAALQFGLKSGLLRAPEQLASEKVKGSSLAFRRLCIGR